MTSEAALAYTSLASSHLRRLERSGAIAFKRLGPNGSCVTPRAQLDELIGRLFEAKPGSIEEDFDFG